MQSAKPKLKSYATDCEEGIKSLRRLPNLPFPDLRIHGPRNATMSNLDSLAMHLIREGHWSDAVFLYRDELGESITQAEQRVAALAEECGVRHPERWMNWLASAIAGFSLFVLAGLLQWLIAG